LEAYLQYNLQVIQNSKEADVLSMERVRDFAEKNKNKVKKTVAPPTVSEQII